ncbi:hypothetical protein H5410_004957 [Solanum commersonii]|uniref:Uncharacterized protein n=1 Tax=Solanum commersonii TaxID=4109 RepID=A0A9J6A633_SOLCO|nr:hypothetical protein H5410_004957 [Solanum commersonii]
MVTIYQFKATKEKHHIMLDQATMESMLLYKSKLLKEGYYCSIQATNEMVWPNQVMLPCKHSIMLVQANITKGIISQSKATMRSSTQATMNGQAIHEGNPYHTSS